MDKNKKKMPFIQKQPPMTAMLYALIPVSAAAIYYFGWRFVAVLAVSIAVGILCEYLFSLVYKQKVTASVLVTAVLFALSLPPALPLWMAAVGMAFGIIFGKMVFGGFGKNIFNPAISGRAFIYISFGVPMTGQFILPESAGAGRGFAAWLTQADAVSNATPLTLMAEGEAIALADLFFGNIAGSFGETCALFIILGGIYIVYKKAANWRFIAASLLGFLVLSSIFYIAGIGRAVHPVYALFAGSFLFAAVFMITDPVSASQTTNTGRWIYGLIFGVLTVLIRTFSVWPEGVSFAILFANMFAPLIDHLIKEQKARRKEVSA